MSTSAECVYQSREEFHEDLLYYALDTARHARLALERMAPDAVERFTNEASYRRACNTARFHLGNFERIEYLLPSLLVEMARAEGLVAPCP